MKKTFKLSNKAYDILKWVGLTVIPALLIFFGVISATVDIPNGDKMLTIGVAFGTFYNALIGVQAVNYKNK